MNAFYERGVTAPFFCFCAILYLHMNKLEESRKKIDETDRQLAALFEERFHAVEDVLEYKWENNLPVLDSSREKAVIEKNTAYVEDEALKPYFQEWMQSTMDISREYQKDLLKQKERKQ